MIDANPKLKQWRNRVRADIAADMRRQGLTPLPPEVPVRLRAVFYFRRPQSHLSTRGSLRPSAPRQRVSPPDVDKLARALLDAATGAAFYDDRQVVELTAIKDWAPPGEDAFTTWAITALERG